MTIIARGNRFGLKVWDRGKAAYRWVGTFDTEDEAQAAEKGESTLQKGNVPTVEEWVRIWLSDYSRPAESTRQTYRSAAKQIVEHLGKRQLDDISRTDARHIHANDWPRNTTRVARTIWADAKRDDVIEHNPWTNMRLETPKGRKDIDALTEDEIDQLGDLALRVHGDYGPEARAIILTLGHTAMRPAEVCALRWIDLNPDEQEVTVGWSRVGTNRVKKPKNGLGRLVVLPQKAIDAIADVPQVIGSEYVFHSKRGKALNKSNLYYVWREVRAAWLAEGERYITPYALRHAAATALIERGVAVGDVGFQLGHKDGGRLVMERYGHPGEDAMRERLKMAQAAERTQSGRRRKTA